MMNHITVGHEYTSGHETWTIPESRFRSLVSSFAARTKRHTSSKSQSDAASRCYENNQIIATAAQLNLCSAQVNNRMISLEPPHPRCVEIVTRVDDERDEFLKPIAVCVSIRG